MNSLINNDDGNDSYCNNHDNIINRMITADCKNCHRSCVFAAACTVSLSSFLGFALREVISVRLGILSQTLEPMGGEWGVGVGGRYLPQHPCGAALLVGYIRGYKGRAWWGRGGACENEETPS